MRLVLAALLLASCALVDQTSELDAIGVLAAAFSAQDTAKPLLHMVDLHDGELASDCDHGLSDDALVRVDTTLVFVSTADRLIPELDDIFWPLDRGGRLFRPPRA